VRLTSVVPHDCHASALVGLGRAAGVCQDQLVGVQTVCQHQLVGILPAVCLPVAALGGHVAALFNSDAVDMRRDD
jgi:hypothetical protein